MIKFFMLIISSELIEQIEINNSQKSKLSQNVKFFLIMRIVLITCNVFLACLQPFIDFISIFITKKYKESKEYIKIEMEIKQENIQNFKIFFLLLQCLILPIPTIALLVSIIRARSEIKYSKPLIIVTITSIIFIFSILFIIF